MLGAPGSESLALPSSLSMLTLLEISPSLMALKTISTMMTPVLIYSGCHNKIPQTEGLKNRIFKNFSEFWRLKVQDKGASRAGFCKNSLPGLQPSLCAFTQPVFCTHTHTHRERQRSHSDVSSSSSKDYWIKALPSWPHLIVITFLKGPISKHSHMGVLEFWHKFWGDTSQSITTIKIITPTWAQIHKCNF